MSTSDKDIDQLFRTSFKNYEMAEDHGEWTVIEKKLNATGFFKFSLFKFNIYTLSTGIALIAGAILYLILRPDDIASEKYIHPPYMNSSGSKRNSVPISDSVGQPLNTENKLNSSGKNIKKITANSNLSAAKIDSAVSIKSDSLILTESKNKTTDSSQVAHSLPSPDNILPSLSTPQIKKKRLVYVTLQDTLIVVDTLKKKGKPTKGNRR